jgi:hypothetical protein
MLYISTKHIAIISCLVGFAPSSLAALLNYSVTYDGTNQVLDEGSDPMAGTSLSYGDSYLLDLHAKSDGYWKVKDGNWSFSIYASPQFIDAGARTGNVTSTFFMDGTQVALDNDIGISQSLSHAGGQGISLSSGLLFDQIIVDYTLISSTSNTTIFNTNDIYYSLMTEGSYWDTRVEYIPATIPIPPALYLFGSGLLGLIGLARKKG